MAANHQASFAVSKQQQTWSLNSSCSDDCVVCRAVGRHWGLLGGQYFNISFKLIFLRSQMSRFSYAEAFAFNSLGVMLRWPRCVCVSAFLSVLQKYMN